MIRIRNQKVVNRIVVVIVLERQPARQLLNGPGRAKLVPALPVMKIDDEEQPERFFLRQLVLSLNDTVHFGVHIIGQLRLDLRFIDGFRFHVQRFPSKRNAVIRYPEPAIMTIPATTMTDAASLLAPCRSLSTIRPSSVPKTMPISRSGAI